MKKEKILYWLLGILFVGYVVVEQYSPKPINWTPTFSQFDKDPFGSFILYDRLDDIFSEGKKVTHQTLYQLKDSTGQCLIICQNFTPSREDIKSVYARLEMGYDVLIAAEFFSEDFLDTFGIEDQLKLKFPKVDEITLQDTLKILIKGEIYEYQTSLVKSQFVLNDSTDWKVLAEGDQPLMISKHVANGKLILSSTPLIFTNYGMLFQSNFGFVETALNELNNGEIIYNRYYHSGRMESGSPFRYMISQDSFRWAIYLTLTAILILLIFGSQRKQRVIPLLDPNENTTVNYIKTIGGLFYREANHKSAAQKIIHYFLRTLSEKYYIAAFFTEESYAVLAVKTGLKKQDVIETFDMIEYVRNTNQISEETLKKLYKKISKFNIA